MWIPFYDIALFLYRIAIIASSLTNKKAKQWTSGRKNLFRKIENSLNYEFKTVWFHCASLGEFEQGRPVLEEFRKQFPEYKIVLTFFSPSGYEVRKNYSGADYIFYIPFDTKSNARRFIDLIKPAMVFFVKYELWYHYLCVLQEKKIPHFLISAIFRKDQFFFRWYGKWFQTVLKKFTIIFCQNNQSVLLLRSKGFVNCEISGDTRFDRVIQIEKENKKIALAEEFSKNSFVIVAGSTWPEDEYFFINFINNVLDPTNAPEAFHRVKLIIVPHDIDPVRIEKLKSGLKVSTIKFTTAEKENIPNAKVLIINTIGMLSQLYRYGDLAYIGGGFGKGIHNILEAAAWGKAVIFGPNYHKFSEAVELAEMSGAFPVNDFKELEERIRFLIQNEMILKMASMLCKNYVRQKAGATEKILHKIKNYT